MKILVTGSRSWTTDEHIQKIIDVLSEFTEHEEVIVVHGACRGVDTLSGVIASELGYKVIEYPVTNDDWKTQGKRAGILRNERMYMSERPFDLVIAFHDDLENSRGTKHMTQFVRSIDADVNIRYVV